MSAHFFAVFFARDVRGALAFGAFTVRLFFALDFFFATIGSPPTKAVTHG